MRKSSAAAAVCARLGLAPGRCSHQVQSASDAGLLPKASGTERLELTPHQLTTLFIAIIADRGIAQTPRSVVAFGGLADSNGNTLAQTLEAMFAGRIPVSDADDLLLSLQPGTECASLGSRHYGATAPSSAAAHLVAIPAESLASIAAEFVGAKHGR